MDQACSNGIKLVQMESKLFKSDDFVRIRMKMSKLILSQNQTKHIQAQSNLLEFDQICPNGIGLFNIAKVFSTV